MPPPFVRVEDVKRRYEREAVTSMRHIMFDDIILALRLADAGFERGDLEPVDDWLCQAQDILLALRTYLWGEATELSQLYRELLDANLQKNRGQAAQVLSVVEGLAEAGRHAAERAGQEELRPVAGAAAGR